MVKSELNNMLHTVESKSEKEKTELFSDQLMKGCRIRAVSDPNGGERFDIKYTRLKNCGADEIFSIGDLEYGPGYQILLNKFVDTASEWSKEQLQEFPPEDGQFFKAYWESKQDIPSKELVEKTQKELMEELVYVGKFMQEAKDRDDSKEDIKKTFKDLKKNDQEKYENAIAAMKTVEKLIGTDQVVNLKDDSPDTKDIKKLLAALNSKDIQKFLEQDEKYDDFSKKFKGFDDPGRLFDKLKRLDLEARMDSKKREKVRSYPAKFNEFESNLRGLFRTYPAEQEMIRRMPENEKRVAAYEELNQNTFGKVFSLFGPEFCADLENDDPEFKLAAFGRLQEIFDQESAIMCARQLNELSKKGPDELRELAERLREEHLPKQWEQMCGQIGQVICPTNIVAMMILFALNPAFLLIAFVPAITAALDYRDELKKVEAKEKKAADLDIIAQKQTNAIASRIAMSTMMALMMDENTMKKFGLKKDASTDPLEDEKVKALFNRVYHKAFLAVRDNLSWNDMNKEMKADQLRGNSAIMSKVRDIQEQIKKDVFESCGISIEKSKDKKGGMSYAAVNEEKFEKFLKQCSSTEKNSERDGMGFSGGINNPQQGQAYRQFSDTNPRKSFSDTYGINSADDIARIQDAQYKADNAERKNKGIMNQIRDKFGVEKVDYSGGKDFVKEAYDDIRKKGTHGLNTMAPEFKMKDKERVGQVHMPKFVQEEEEEVGMER